jgi:hypothetical protein
MKIAVFWRFALMMEAARTSETLVNFYQTTRCSNPEDSNLHTHRRENLKSYLDYSMMVTVIIMELKRLLFSYFLRVRIVAARPECHMSHEDYSYSNCFKITNSRLFIVNIPCFTTNSVVSDNFSEACKSLHLLLFTNYCTRLKILFSMSPRSWSYPEWPLHILV